MSAWCSEFCPFIQDCRACEYQGGVERDTPSRGAPVTHGNGILDEPEKAAPEGAGNTSEGLTPGTSPRSNLGGKPVATTQDTPDRHLDGCPACMTRDNAPITTERPDVNTLIGHYLCRACGQDWTCSWWEAVA